MCFLMRFAAIPAAAAFVMLAAPSAAVSTVTNQAAPAPAALPGHDGYLALSTSAAGSAAGPDSILWD
jgi:hypothetical protein